MPRPQWLGMRPKRRRPTGVRYSPQTRFTAIESLFEFCPALGAPCGVENEESGEYPPRPTTW